MIWGDTTFCQAASRGKALVNQVPLWDLGDLIAKRPESSVWPQNSSQRREVVCVWERECERERECAKAQSEPTYDFDYPSKHIIIFSGNEFHRHVLCGQRTILNGLVWTIKMDLKIPMKEWVNECLASPRLASHEPISNLFLWIVKAAHINISWHGTSINCKYRPLWLYSYCR